MKYLHTHSRTTFFLCLAVLMALGEARTLPKKKVPFQLILTPIHTATFAFYIIFGFFTVFQAFSAFFKSFAALRSIGGRARLAPGALDFSTGGIYPHLVFLGACSALVTYVLSAVWAVFTLNSFVQRPVTDSFTAGRYIVEDISEFFICFAMLALLFHRVRTAYGTKSRELRPYRYKLIFDACLLIAYLAVIITYTFLLSVYSTQTNTLDAYYKLLTINRIAIGIFFSLAINITVSSIWTWLKLKQISHPDAAMLGQMVMFISPMLLIRAIFRVVQYVLIYGKAGVTVAELDSLRLAHIIVMGITYFVIMVFAL